MRTGRRELFYVVAMALAGLGLAVVVALSPWHAQHSAPGTTVVELVTPGGVAGQR
jgi:hypothetical protein